MYVTTMATDLPHEVATKCLPIQRNLDNEATTRGKTQRKQKVFFCIECYKHLKHKMVEGKVNDFAIF